VRCAFIIDGVQSWLGCWSETLPKCFRRLESIKRRREGVRVLAAADLVRDRSLLILACIVGMVVSSSGWLVVVVLKEMC
jgi:hypothetical protein